MWVEKLNFCIFPHLVETVSFKYTLIKFRFISIADTNQKGQRYILNTKLQLFGTGKVS